MPVVACFHLPQEKSPGREIYWAMFQMMAASVRRVRPDAEIHLLTLGESVVPEGIACDVVFRAEIDTPLARCWDRLMLEEMRCWDAYIRSSHFAGPTMLVDADLLVQKDPFALFDGAFDIGLTYTLDPRAPCMVNAGVILADDRRREVVHGFFGRLVERVSSYDAKEQKWNGDQRALDDAVCREAIAGAETPVFDSQNAGVRFRLWPCELWNYSEPYGPDLTPVFKPAPEPGIVHFKGKRKTLMFRYLTEVLGIPATADPAAPGGLVFSSRETPPAARSA